MGGLRTNQLNNLTGSEWLYFTNTLYITNFPLDQTHRLRQQHGAIKPPKLMAQLIEFFTKEKQIVLDPFAGVGSTLVGASLCGRSALGFELNPKWVEIYGRLQEDYVIDKNELVLKEASSVNGKELVNRMLEGDCLDLLKSLKDNSIDAVITDPPYGCQHSTATFRKETNFNMFSSEEKDFGNASSFSVFLDKIETLGQEVYRVLKSKKYFVLIIGDRYKDGEYIPLGYLVAERLKGVGFSFKGIRIWSNKTTQRPLKPYAVPISFVPNITHQNILILKKPD